MIILLLNLFDIRLENLSINFRRSFCSIYAIFPTELFGHTLPPDGVDALDNLYASRFFY